MPAESSTITGVVWAVIIIAALYGLGWSIVEWEDRQRWKNYRGKGHDSDASGLDRNKSLVPRRKKRCDPSLLQPIIYGGRNKAGKGNAQGNNAAPQTGTTNSSVAGSEQT